MVRESTEREERRPRHYVEGLDVRLARCEEQIIATRSELKGLDEKVDGLGHKLDTMLLALFGALGSALVALFLQLLNTGR